MENKVKPGTVNGEVIHDLLSLCDDFFVEYMVHPFAGANRECLFCGATEGRDGSADHSASDCPIVKYADIIKKHKGMIVSS